MVPDDVLVETTCDGGVLGTCNPNEMKRAVRVKICDESTPPAPVDVTVTRCGGATDLVSSTDAPSTQVIINGTTEPLPVCVVGDKDFAEVYKCDANTGNTILIRTVLDHDTSAFVTTYFDLVLGATWAGNPATDLTECQSNALESDQIIGCDGGVAVTQWIVKDNGQPTGVVYYTDVTGAVVTPVAWTPGACVTAEVTRSVDVIDDCAGTVTSETVANRIQEVIINGSEKPIDVRIKESCVTESRVDVEYFKFCDDGNTNANFIRRVERTYSVAGALLSETIVDTETDLTTPYVVVGNAVVCQPENPVDFEQRCVQDSSPTPIKGIELRERLADGTYAVVGYVESDGTTAWTPVAPVTDCDTGSVGTTPVELCVVEQSTIALNLIPAVAGNVVTVTLDTTGTTTAITNEVVDFGDGSVSISPVHSYDYSLVADGSYIISARVVDSNGASLIQAVAVTVTGGVPVLGTLPAAKTTTYDVQVAKVFRSFDGSGTVLWTVDENGVAFTPGVGQTVVPCDSCGCNEKPCESFCFSSKPTNGTSVVPVTNLTKTVQRLAAPYVVVTNYSSATVTAISADVTIDGVSIPAGFTWSVDSSTNQIFTDTVSITGTDYIVTEVR